MLRRLFRDSMELHLLVDQSPSVLRCGLVRKKKNRKESSVRTDRQNNSSMLFSVLSLSTNKLNISRDLRLRDSNRTTSSARVDLRAVTKTIEVTIVVAEVAREVVATETSSRVTLVVDQLLSPSLSLRFPMPEFPYSLFLKLTLQILVTWPTLRIERHSLVTLFMASLSSSSVSNLLVASQACSLMRM